MMKQYLEDINEWVPSASPPPRSFVRPDEMSDEPPSHSSCQGPSDLHGIGLPDACPAR
jgi:hypothetical protein